MWNVNSKLFDTVREAMAKWLRCLPLNPAVVVQSLHWVTIVILHMTPVLVGSRNKSYLSKL